MTLVRSIPFYDGLRLPSNPLPVDFSKIPGEARQLAKMAEPYAERLAKQARYGSRLAARVVPLVIAAEAGWYLAGRFQGSLPFGHSEWTFPGWTLDLDCGRAPQVLRWFESPAGCGPDQVIGTAVGRPQEGPAKGFAYWSNVVPFRYYINGVSVLGDPSRKYSAFFFGNVTPMIRPWAGWPTDQAMDEEIPIAAALAPAVATAPGRPARTPMPVPIGAWPGIRPNPNVPSSVQIQTDTHSAAQPTKQEVFPVAVGLGVGGDVETFPVGIPGLVDILFPPTEVVGVQPGHSIEVTPTSTAVLNAPHEWRKPEKGEKEVKPGRSILMRVINEFTESGDLIDAAYNATDPCGRKLRGDRLWWKDKGGNWRTRVTYNRITPQEKANFVYRNFDKLDLRALAANLIKNEIGDRFYGGIGGRLSQAGARLGLRGQADTSRLSGVKPKPGPGPLKAVYDLVDDQLGVPRCGEQVYSIRYGKKVPYPRGYREGSSDSATVGKLRARVPQADFQYGSFL